MASRETEPLHRADPVAAKDAEAPRKREKLVDDALEKTFPASDPPSYVGGSATGGPKKGTVKPGEVAGK